MRRILGVAAATLCIATVLIAVPLSAPVQAHGGACSVAAPQPRYVNGDIRVEGAFSCPTTHQTTSISVRVEAKGAISGDWAHYGTFSRSTSGTRSISLATTVNQLCSVSAYRTVVKGLAGSSGTVTHSRSAQSPELRIRCA